METLKRDQEVLSYPYGIPNSLGETGQQWDFPNSWPPSVHMIIVGLLQSGGNEKKVKKLCGNFSKRSGRPELSLWNTKFSW